MFCWRSIGQTTGDEVGPGTCKRDDDEFCQVDLGAAMVGWETMAVASERVVEC